MRNNQQHLQRGRIYPFPAFYAMMKLFIPALLTLFILAWGCCTYADDSEVTVCILDSGSNLAHTGGWNYLSNSSDLTDYEGHGTRVETLLRALAPESQIYMLKCFESEISINEEAMVRALYAAVDDYHADIINMSWIITKERPALYKAVEYAYNQGVILVAPAGNLTLATGIGSKVYPAAWEEVIGVGGVNLSEEGLPVSSLWFLSGEAVYVCARGDFQDERGSSYAAPRVAAFIANYLTQTPDATQEEVRRFLQGAALDLGKTGYDTIYGWGYIQAEP